MRIVRTLARVVLADADDHIIVDPEAMFALAAFHGFFAKLIAYLESLAALRAADLQGI